MNVLKNFEVLFIVTLGLACAANYALDNTAVETKAAQVAAAPNMQVVVVSAKRLSAEEKKQSLLDERASTLAAASTPARKI